VRVAGKEQGHVVVYVVVRGLIHLDPGIARRTLVGVTPQNVAGIAVENGYADAKVTESDISQTLETRWFRSQLRTEEAAAVVSLEESDHVRL
jgi:hypothetical protein